MKSINFKSSRFSYEYIFNISIFLFLIIFLSKQYKNIQINFLQSGWLSGDWLINYSGGFIRRGFLGEVSRQLYQFFNIDLLTFILNMKFFLYVLFLICLFVLTLVVKLNTFELLLLLSPWALLFDFYDPGGSGRKEVVLFLFFTIYTLLGTLFKTNIENTLKNWRFYFLPIAFIVILLTHEGLYFFLPLFLVVGMIQKNNFSINPRSHIDFYLAFLVATLMNLITFLFFQGGKEQSVAICESILNANIDYSLCKGAISSLAGFAYSFHYGYAVNFFPVFLLSFIPIILYARSIFKVDDFYKFIFISLLVFIFTLPIYYLGVDWGRWIRITAFLTFIALLSKRSRSKLFWNLSIPITKFFFIFSPILYLTIWKIPHYIGDKTNILFLNQDWYNFLETINRFFMIT